MTDVTTITVPSEQRTEDQPLRTKAAALAEARQALHDAKAKHDAAKKAYEESQADVIAAYKAARKAEGAAKSELDEAVLWEYNATGNKRPMPSDARIEVREFPVAKFDYDRAREWCLSEMPSLLSLNADAYEDLLEMREQSDALKTALKSMPGRVVSVPKAFIPSDLSQYLED